ncbi:MAG: hypothetical protein SCK57_13090, partial [Bacillota bacterium]|nr:hypothetical protein [Bacillota bacterium]
MEARKQGIDGRTTGSPHGIMNERFANEKTEEGLSMKEPVQNKRIISIAGAFIGFCIGAAFATGQ